MKNLKSNKLLKIYLQLLLMGYDYLIRVTVDINKSSIKWTKYDQNKILTLISDLTTRHTFPEFGVKTRGYWSCGDASRDNSYFLKEELKLLSERLEDLSFYVYHFHFDMEYLTVYHCFNGSVLQQGTIDMNNTVNIGSLSLTFWYNPMTADFGYDITQLFTQITLDFDSSSSLDFLSELKLDDV
jgi:hypothetical protein